VGFPIRKSADQSSFAAPHGLSQRSTSFIASQRQGIHQMPLRHLIALILNAHRGPWSRRADRTSAKSAQHKRKAAFPPRPKTTRKAWTSKKDHLLLLEDRPDARAVKPGSLYRRILRQAGDATKGCARRREKTARPSRPLPGPADRTALHDRRSGRSSSSRCQTPRARLAKRQSRHEFQISRTRTAQGPPKPTRAEQGRTAARAHARGRREAAPINQPPRRAAEGEHDKASNRLANTQPSLVEPDGIEPTTSCLQSRRSPN
jgi:hypothetical protein